MTLQEQAQLAAARVAGIEAARNAASWTTDGTTDVLDASRLLAMLDDGDPAAYDYLPRYPDLSGEWADDPTPLSLAREITGDDDPAPDVIDALAEAWEEAVAETFTDACEAELRRFLGV